MEKPERLSFSGVVIFQTSLTLCKRLDCRNMSEFFSGFEGFLMRVPWSFSSSYFCFYFFPI